MEGGGFGNWSGNGKEKGSGSEVVVACDDLVAASRFEFVTRKRADRSRRRKMGSSPAPDSVSASVTAAAPVFSSPSSTFGFSRFTVFASGQHVAPFPVAAVTRPPPLSSLRLPIFRLTHVYVRYHLYFFPIWVLLFLL